MGVQYICAGRQSVGHASFVIFARANINYVNLTQLPVLGYELLHHKVQ